MDAPEEHVIRWGDGYETWCQLWPSHSEATGLPVVVLHGGPGSTHDYLRDLRRLCASGRDVVLYDQIGNGNSTRLPDRSGDADLWSPPLFVDELEHVIDHFGYDRTGYHLLGQSWGGMLGIEWGIEQRAGLASLILSNSPSSMVTWSQEATRLRELMPASVRDTLDRHESAGTTDADEYGAATIEFYRRHFCRLDPWPQDFQRSLDLCDEDPTVYQTMVGPTEFHIVGSLSRWDRDDDLHLIDVPVLVLHGEHDEATDLVVAACRQKIRDVHYVKVAGASHSPHLEQPDVTFDAFESFLARHDRGSVR